LAAAFLKGYEKKGVMLNCEALECLEAYDWPGNVRELKAVLESAANLAEKGEILPKHLRIPDSAKCVIPADGPSEKPGVRVGALEPMAEVERRHILSVYETLGNNKTQTARILEIGLQTLYRKLKEYGVD